MGRLLVAILALVALLVGCTAVPTRSAEPRSTSPVAATGRLEPAAHAPARTPDRLATEHGSAWRIAHADAHGIAGFANRVSVLPGQPVVLYVSTDAPLFQVHAFRMGWYRGDLGQLVWTSGYYPGRRQPGPALVAPATGTVAARWQPSLTVDTTGWLPGDYLLRLDGTGGRSGFVPLTVRAASAAGRVVLINAVTTWQAYNTWGCCDLYAGADGTFDTRSRAVSFDRPYAQEDGAGQFVEDELPVVAEAERLGLRLDYVTDIDLATVPNLLAGARAVVSLGHDEYWSPAMRAAVAAALDAGTNLAFLGANAIFRRIRLAATPLGPDRLEINYKVPTEDPLYGRDDAAVTANWPAPPAPDPESRLLGDQYGCLLLGDERAPGVIVDPHSWLFRGVHVTAGQRLPGLIGPEIDAVQPGFPTPHRIEMLLHSPVQCPTGAPAYADTSYYVAPSGAGVFDAGTIRWACAVYGDCEGRVAPVTGLVVRTVTDNLLRAFAAGPAAQNS